jgi:hypothetical protein
MLWVSSLLMCTAAGTQIACWGTCLCLSHPQLPPSAAATAAAPTTYCQIDKLQTDHRGTFVLRDLNFKWLMRFAPGTSALPAVLIAGTARQRDGVQSLTVWAWRSATVLRELSRRAHASP